MAAIFNRDTHMYSGRPNMNLRSYQDALTHTHARIAIQGSLVQWNFGLDPVSIT